MKHKFVIFVVAHWMKRIDQQIINRKSISRKITHPQSLFKAI